MLSSQNDSALMLKLHISPLSSQDVRWSKQTHLDFKKTLKIDTPYFYSDGIWFWLMTLIFRCLAREHLNLLSWDYKSFSFLKQIPQRDLEQTHWLQACFLTRSQLCHILYMFHWVLRVCLCILSTLVWGNIYNLRASKNQLACLIHTLHSWVCISALSDCHAVHSCVCSYICNAMCSCVTVDLNVCNAYRTVNLVNGPVMESNNKQRSCSTP